MVMGEPSPKHTNTDMHRNTETHKNTEAQDIEREDWIVPLLMIPNKKS